MDIIEKAIAIIVVVFILVLLVGAEYIPDAKYNDFSIGWFFIVVAAILVVIGVALIQSCFTA
jgi:hypothetical protein